MNVAPEIIKRVEAELTRLHQTEARAAALEADRERLRDALQVLMPPDEALDLYAEMLGHPKDYYIDPYFAPQWQAWLDVRAALSATAQETP